MHVAGTMRLKRRTRWRVLAASAVLAAGCMSGRTQPSDSPGRVLLDRVVAVVNNNAILASDVEREMRLSVLEPRRRNETPDRKSTLNRLISRNLIQQQIRREEEAAATPSDDDVRARIHDLRTELPACVQANCASDEGWKAFLAANRLTTDQVERYVHLRLEFLSFIETRFRQGVHITPEEIEAYYRNTLLPQYPKDQTPPTVESVSERIQEILLQEQVSKLFSAWLDNLRRQGDVQVLDPSLEMAGVENGDSGDER